MALAGTLKDFSLADIFQLIGLQKKTGILTLCNDKEEARILFMNGLVVGADTNSQKLENHLGHVLVKSNLITQDELEEVLVIQSHTLQRLGQVLIQKGFIKPEDLRESLQTQTTQIIYRLFRWQDGEYHFQQEPSVDYDQENFEPISAESILMEGIRMLDEWPIIERIIPNFDVLLEKTERGEALRIDIGSNFSLESSAGASFDSLLEGVLSDEEQDRSEQQRNSHLEPRQEMVLGMVDGISVVQDLIDRSGMNEFDTCRTLYDLMEMGYVRRALTQSSASGIRVIEEEHQIPAWIPVGLLGLMALFSFLLGWNPVNQFFPLPPKIESMGSHYQSASNYRLDQVEAALSYYYLREGKLPVSLADLAAVKGMEGLLTTDPMGRDLLYNPSFQDNSFQLSALSRSGQRTPKLERNKTFSGIDALGSGGLE